MKKFFLGLLAMMVSATLFAAPRTAEEAALIAAQFTNQQPQLRKLHKSPRAAANMRLAHKALQNNSQEAAYYVFNQEDNNGFVIVSADDRTAEDVLGYTENGAFDMNTVNPNLKWWLSRYAEEITVLQTMDDSELEPRKAVQVTAIAPLLVNQNGEEITWYQETPYNNLCPMDLRDNTRSLTGCVATAASQIMYKWRWPQTGTGSSSYVWKDCKNKSCSSYEEFTLSANYGETTYAWDDMLPAYEGVSATTAQKNAVATLMYHAGVSCEMTYGGYAAGGSGAWTDYMAYALMTYFDYDIDKFITMYKKTDIQDGVDYGYGEAHDGVPAEYNVTRNQFTTYFNADLEAGRPIIMGGDGDGGGHEFVCDGRDANNRFHINFGWEGSGNGYYALSALTPDAEDDFSNNLDAIIGLRPKQNLPPVTVTWSVEGVTSTTSVVPGKMATPASTPADCNCGKKFMGWTAQSSIQGGAKPDDLFTTGKVVNEATTFYAVFAEQQGEGTAVETTTYTFTSKAWAESTNSWTKDQDGNQYTSGQGVQVTEGTTGAGAHTKASLNNVSNVTVNYCTNANKGAGNIEISVGNTAVTHDVTKNGGTALRDLEFAFTNASGSVAIVVNCTTNSIYVNSVSITAGGGATYSNYALTCGCSGSAIENTKAAAKAVKVMENGQIVIVRDNEKYTIFGQKIQ